MATVKTAIALYDGVTSPLAAMHRAMNIVINSFETMQNASGNAVDVSAIQEAREELARAKPLLMPLKIPFGTPISNSKGLMVLSGAGLPPLMALCPS